jgi:small subunit ribosomal protein S9
MPEATSKIISRAVGRRKSAIASVWLTHGKGKITVNDQPAEKYFPGLQNSVKFKEPFKVADSQKWDATIKVRGGGQFGQLDAAILGLARAISKLKTDLKKPLRDAGLLTRDSRERQRRMVGMGGKSRRQKQSPKR